MASARTTPKAYILNTYGTGKDYAEGNLQNWEAACDLNLPNITDLDGNHFVNDTDIDVLDATPWDDGKGFGAGSKMTIAPGGANEETHNITGVAGNTITIEAPGLANNHDNGVDVAAGALLEVYKEGAAGGLWDESTLLLSGATVTSDFWRMIRGQEDDRHAGIPADDGSVAGFRNLALAGNFIRIVEAYARMEDIVLKSTSNLAASIVTIKLEEDQCAAVGVIIFDSTNAHAAGSIYSFWNQQDGGKNVFFINCMTLNCEGYGFAGNNAGCYWYNCNAIGTTKQDGFNGAAAGYTRINCRATGCADDNFGDASGDTTANCGYNFTDKAPSDVEGAWGVQADSGNTDGIGADANKLRDAGQNFLTTVKVGMIVKNTTDTTYSYVTVVDSDTELTLNDDIMDDGEDYIIFTNIYGTPSYVDAGNDDLHLASDDPGVNKASDLSGDANFPFDDDIDLVTRAGIWDIGFDEYVAAVGAVTTAPNRMMRGLGM